MVLLPPLLRAGKGFGAGDCRDDAPNSRSEGHPPYCEAGALLDGFGLVCLSGGQLLGTAKQLANQLVVAHLQLVPGEIDEPPSSFGNSRL